VLENKEEREHLSVAGLKRAAEFSWKLTAERTREVYTEAWMRHERLR